MREKIRFVLEVIETIATVVAAIAVCILVDNFINVYLPLIFD